jgi:uncharacterized protein (DUF488 family)
MNNAKSVCTIGHSTHELEYFLELLLKQQINCLIDVRSMPASKYNPQYNKDYLQNFLKNSGIRYMHFGQEFGARHDAESVLDDEGIVDFELIRKTYLFQNGIERLDDGISKGYKIVLMCSEGNPLECHRFAMISVYLEEIGIKVKHILKDGSIISHEKLEEELLKKYQKKMPAPTPMFDIPKKDKLKDAYKLLNKEIGWKSNNQDYMEEQL